MILRNLKVMKNLEDEMAESSDFTIDSQSEFTQNKDNQEI